MYKCEIYDCGAETNGILCSEHEKEITNENKQIVICNKCNHIIELRERYEGINKYLYVYKCGYCENDPPGKPPKLIIFKE